MVILQPDRVLLVHQIRRFAPELSGDLLDVGSNEGKRYRNLFPQVTSYRTLDINTAFHPDIVGSAEAIPLNEGSVDSILCTQVLEHVPHPWKAIDEMYRVLRPGGKALITVPQWNELHEEPHDYFRYTCFGLQSMCTDAGFTVLTVQQRGGYHACRAQMFVRHLIDIFHPYEHKAVMLFLGPWCAIVTRIALFRDRRDSTQASRKHAIGWLILLQKSL